MATSKYLSQLAKHTQAKINKVAYGHLRGKLKKKGFSEIALYAAVGRHCEENDIPPFDMSNDMLDLLQGCVENEFFIRIDNRFSYLAREYHELRYADTDKGEMKCPEQRGQFLCNSCHLVKKDKERAGGKSGYTCKICHQEKSAEAYRKKQKQKKEQTVLSTPVPKPPAEKKVVEITPEPELETELIDVPEIVQEEVHELHPSDELIELSPDEMDNLLVPTEPEQIVAVKTKPKELFQITQILGDTDETEFKIVCDTQDLPTVIGIFKKLQGVERDSL